VEPSDIRVDLRTRSRRAFVEYVDKRCLTDHDGRIAG
jgi:hypothetical protein